MKVGDKVQCPYRVQGVVTGFISSESVLVDVIEVEKSMRGKKVITKEFKCVHVYEIDQLEVIE